MRAAGRTSLELAPDEIVDAAIEIFHEQGLDAVSMRSVSARLAVSPVPLYNRVGNKAALLDAMADRFLAGMAPPFAVGEPWSDYATRWAQAVRRRLSATPDIRLLLGDRRAPFVEASRPLIDALRSDGFAPDAAVQACRLLLWAVVGFAAVETRRPDRGPRRHVRRPGGDPSGVSKGESDQLFELHIAYLLAGIERDR
jgi:TetR/AcrR family transcriptional regulator, tetracycline repressor protein